MAVLYAVYYLCWNAIQFQFRTFSSPLTSSNFVSRGGNWGSKQVNFVNNKIASSYLCNFCLACGLSYTRCPINAYWLEWLQFLLNDNLYSLLLVMAPEREGRPRSSTHCTQRQKRVKITLYTRKPHHYGKSRPEMHSSHIQVGTWA